MSEDWQSLVKAILTDFPNDPIVRKILNKKTVHMVGDLTLEQPNKQAWINKRKKVIIDGRETTFSPGDRIRLPRVPSRTAILTEDNRFKDEQIPQLFFDAPSAWVDFARRTDPVNRGKEAVVKERDQIDGWNGIEILVAGSKCWLKAEKFYQATPNRRTQHARQSKSQSKVRQKDLPKPWCEAVPEPVSLLSDEPILLASVPLLSPASEDPTEENNEPVLKRQNLAEENKQPAKRQRRSEEANLLNDQKKELRERYLKFMEETKHARYVPIRFDSSWKAFFRLHYGKKCPFCLSELRTYESDGTLSGEACHVISRFHGSPKVCDRDNLIFGCQICNSRKNGDGMAEMNALAFTIGISEDQFLALSKQLFLFHIGDLTRKDLHGWNWVDLLDCHQYILNRFVKFPYGWTDAQRKRATELLHSEIFCEGKRKQLQHNSNQKAALKAERRQIKNDLKGK